MNIDYGSGDDNHWVNILEGSYKLIMGKTFALFVAMEHELRMYVRAKFW